MPDFDDEKEEDTEDEENLANHGLHEEDPAESGSVAGEDLDDEEEGPSEEDLEELDEEV